MGSDGGPGPLRLPRCEELVPPPSAQRASHRRSLHAAAFALPPSRCRCLLPRASTTHRAAAKLAAAAALPLPPAVMATPPTASAIVAVVVATADVVIVVAAAVTFTIIS